MEDMIKKEVVAIQKKISSILDISSPLKKILLSEVSLKEKRQKIRMFLAEILTSIFEVSPSIQPLEWILTREALQVFRQILSLRSEELVGFSFLQYINDWLNGNNVEKLEKPQSGFFKEFEHLLKGISGKTGLYKTEKLPSFSKYKGQKASKLRSNDLSRMARANEKFKVRYPCGLDGEAVRRRSRNKSRILQYFRSTELEWNNWKWHIRNIVRNPDTLSKLIRLTDEEYTAIKGAREYNIPFGITPYYVSLMDFESDRTNDYAIRAQVIPSLHYIKRLKEQRECKESSIDFMIEHDTTPIEGITRRYPNIVILKPVLTCPQICVYCQRNWELEEVYSSNAVLSEKKLDRAIQWIEETPEINEVLVTGGDPLLLSDERIDKILFRLSKIDRIVRIRIGTRTPVTLPQRITDALIRRIIRFHVPGRREIIIITHYEHQYEITPQSMEAVQKFRRQGLEIYNQLVYTFYNSKRFEASALRQKLRLIGVTPYYTFNTKGKDETDDFRVPIPRLLQEQDEEARLMPGSVRTDEIVFNVPGLGKNYLNAKQHHDVISILPDGRRVYEFHPWEKKLALADTYIYKDVSIYDYLKRLKSVGEKISDYKTIWYYY